MNILVVGDAHAKPVWNKTRTKSEMLPWEVTNARFDALGKMIVDTRPDAVVIIGDLADMKSLSSYDKGKRSAELQRLDLDEEAATDAMKRIMDPLRSLQEHQKKIKDKIYKPRLIYTIGNHEIRRKRLAEDQPLFYSENGLQEDVAGAENLGWEVYPFLDPAEINGVYFQHYFTSGVMGRAIGGEHPAHSMLKLLHRSAVVGHGHVFDYCTRGNQIHKRITTMQVGCFFGYHEDYAGPANHMWWRGLVWMKNVEDGDYGVIQYPYKEVMATWGNGSVEY